MGYELSHKEQEKLAKWRQSRLRVLEVSIKNISLYVFFQLSFDTQHYAFYLHPCIYMMETQESVFSGFSLHLKCSND